MNLDIIINQFIESVQTPFLTKVFKMITQLGSTKVLLPLSIILVLYLFYKRRKIDATLSALTLVIGISVSELIKLVIHRARPINALVIETDPSFPSGHTIMSVIFFLLLIFLFKDKIRSKIIRRTMITICIVLPLLIGFSRLYLNIHWFTDVLTGFLIGIGAILLFLHHKEKHNKNKK